MGFDTVGELAEDGVPEPLQVALNDRARVMLVPTVGFEWITGAREMATPGRSECMLVLPTATDDEVDATIERARQAGGDIVTEPKRHRWGYSGPLPTPTVISGWSVQAFRTAEITRSRKSWSGPDVVPTTA